FSRMHSAGAKVVSLRKTSAVPSFSAISALWRYFRRTRPSIVHLHGAEANFHGTIAARMAGISIIIAEEIGIPRHSRKARLICRGLYSQADKVVAISEAVKRSIV